MIENPLGYSSTGVLSVTFLGLSIILLGLITWLYDSTLPESKNFVIPGISYAGSLAECHSTNSDSSASIIVASWVLFFLVFLTGLYLVLIAGFFSIKNLNIMYRNFLEEYNNE